MKKIISILSIFVFVIMLFSGCGEQPKQKTAYELLEGNDKKAYSLLEKGSRNFKNPSSIRVIEGVNYKLEGKDAIIVRISAENGFGGHNTGVYSMDTDGDVVDISKEKDLVNGFLNGIDTERVKKFDIEKVNKAWIEKHP